MGFFSGVPSSFVSAFIAASSVWILPRDMDVLGDGALCYYFVTLVYSTFTTSSSSFICTEGSRCRCASFLGRL